MTKNSREEGCCQGGDLNTAFMVGGQGKGPMAALQAWMEGTTSRGARRLATGVTVAGSCLTLYALLLILTTNYPTCWTAPFSLGSSTAPPNSSSFNDDHKKQLMPLRIAGASAANPKADRTNISHIVFGIAASSSLWEKRKEYIKLWWNPSEMRGFLWLENAVNYTGKDKKTLPPQRVSSNTDRFKYMNKLGRRSAIRISRIVSETYQLGLPDVHWFVMGDDDTIFVTENLVKLLSKYDHNQFYYIGSNSESHLQNLAFSYSMAYGGGGFAISYPLAKALHSMQDGCLQRYPSLFGSDDRIHACMAEFGVPLTKEPGFHQYDIRGNAFGMMAAHPLAPAISLHHMDALDPVFPNRSKLGALKHLRKSIEEDPAYFLQQSICYDKRRKWSISISWGFAIQIFRGIMSPRELQMPARTFYNWNRRAEYTSFSFNSRAFSRNPCQKPFIFYMNSIRTSTDQGGPVVESDYTLQDHNPPGHCKWRIASPASIRHVTVRKIKDNSMWTKVTRRKCCQVVASARATTLRIQVRDCDAEELAAA